MNEKKKAIILLVTAVLIIAVITLCILVSAANNRKVIEDFEKKFNASETTMILLGKESCGYCKAFQPNLDFMKEYYGFEYEYIDVSKLSSSQFNSILDILNIDTSNFGTPYTAIIGGGKVVDSLSGAVEESELLSFLIDNNVIPSDSKLLINYIDYKEYENVINKETTNIIGIGQTSCIHCKAVKATLNELIKEYKIDINFLNIDTLKTEDLKSLYASFDFFSDEGWGTPSFLIVKNGELLGTISGAQSKETFVTELKKYGMIEV